MAPGQPTLARQHAQDAPPPDRGTTRMDAFSDGFFAIVITLLVLELRPPHLPADVADYVLWEDLAKLWPSFAAFIVSFVNILIMWVSHHELMRITTKADTSFLYLNGGLLFGIAIIPFSTAVLATHILGPGAWIAAGLYCAVLLWTALFFNLIWRYVAARPERLMPNVTPRDRARISRTQLITLALYAAAFALSFVSPMGSVALTLALAVFFGVADRISGFASEDIANDDVHDSMPDTPQSK